MKLLASCLAAGLSGVASASLHSELGLAADEKVFSSYVTDWAHYRKSPYTWAPSNFAGIAGRTDVALYSFMYFCPPAGTSPMPYWAMAPYGSCTDATEFQLMSVDPIDKTGIQTIAQSGVKKTVLSVGGWNFPSAYFSKMVATAESRAKFANSVKQWMSQYGVDGVDLDWEYPCSEARDNPVKISCSKFQNVDDAGGSCPEDTDNLLALVKELRTTLGDGAFISIASQAAKKHADEMDLAAITPFIDMWHVMSYDYSVSDIAGATATAPNAPLYNPPAGVLQMSINQTITHYLASGVPSNKIMVGIPMYAHTWYVPGLTGTAWQKFGLPAKIQGECCGPFKSTYGGKPGNGCSLCGSYMWSEIKAAQPQVFYDNVTQSAIGYLTAAGADGGYTEAGTWLTYSDLTSVKAIAKWADTLDLAGIFVYSADMDTADYEFMNTVADSLGKKTGPTPGPGPTPPGPPSPSGGTPTCAAAGQAALCSTPCSSSCRGFPPGFAAAGCENEGDCTAPPSWAKGSVCTC